MTRAKTQAAVLLASPDDIEAQFYEAMQRADIERLMAVWSDDEDIVCVHPGGPRVVGAGAIRTTFEAIFANGAIPVQPQKVRRVHTEGAAVHNLFERVDVETTEGSRTAWVLATNVYVKTAFGWRMVAHHASAGMPDEPPEITEKPPVLH